MTFSIEITGKTEDRFLIYYADEFSFSVEPVVNATSFDLVLNKLNLSVVSDNRIVEIWGYCGCHWIEMDDEVPKYFQGILRVNKNPEPGFSYKIYDFDLPVYVNLKTKWVCIGDPKNSGEAVEFLNGCVAVLEKGELAALWLKPLELEVSDVLLKKPS